jgi:hypothetical protein
VSTEEDIDMWLDTNGHDLCADLDTMQSDAAAAWHRWAGKLRQYMRERREMTIDTSHDGILA